MRPLVGIAITIYNPPIEFIEAQLRTIAEQTYTNWFCIATCDSPLAPLREEPRLARFFADPRFEFHENPRQLGLIKNFELAGQLCLARNPKYISYADQDDVWLPEKTALLVDALESKPPLSLVHCDMFILRKQADGNYLRERGTAWEVERRGVHHVSPLDFMIRNIAAGAGMLLDAELVRRYPTIPEDAFGHDHWYALVASYFGGVHAVAKPLYDYRIHGANMAGLSEYRGFFAASNSSAKLGVVKKCMQMFNVSRARLSHAIEVGLPVSALDRIVARAPFDLGVGYLLKAVACGSDRALMRSCVVRAVGKVLKFFKPSYNAYSPR